MALESATFIHDLVPANPVHTDGLAQADSHLRLLKSVLQATFPNLTAAVTASPSDLNVTTGLSTVLAGLAPLAGANFTGPVNATSIQQSGSVLIPPGVVVMWFGLATAVPVGWHLCDGTNFTPDLRDRFIVGAGLNYALGTNGGTLNPTGTTALAGAHSHTGATGSAGAVTMFGAADTQGAHAHGGATQSHTLTTAEIPAHTHVILGIMELGTGGTSAGTGNFNSGSFTLNQNGVTDGGTVGSGGHTHGIVTDGAHSHNISVSNVPAHTHPIALDGGHSHTLTMDTRPPYYALCFIMKL